MPLLFDPIRLGAIEAPNRILMAPMTRARGTRDHLPTPMMAEYYAARASAGLIISEAIGISREGMGWPYATGLWTPEQVAGWRAVTDAVHRAGGRIIAQLWHMGRTVHPSFLGGAQPVSASGTTAPGHAHTYAGRQPYEAGRPLGLGEIPRVIEDFRAGARNAMAAGFDGVQIHAANGYLIDEFRLPDPGRTVRPWLCRDHRRHHHPAPSGLMMTTIDTPVALVTGGSSGIGLAIARRFAELGMQVVLVGRRQSALNAAVSSLGGTAVGLAADVTSPADLERMFAEVKVRFGRVDVLVPNAGGGQHAPLGQITEAQFDQQFATNVKGVVFTVQAALPLTKPGASIVIVGSTASIDPGPTMSIYGAPKAAVRNLVRSWVSDLKGSGIRINIVSPGPTNTASLREAFGRHAEEGLAFLTAKSPIGRIGEPEEIAKVAAFLASDAASYVNGVELFADGGASQA